MEQIGDPTLREEDETALPKNGTGDRCGPGRAPAAPPLILLVDGRHLMRSCVASWLRECWPDARVVAAATPEELALPEDGAAPVRLGVLAAPGGLAQDPAAPALLGQLQALLGGRPLIVLAESEQADDVAAAIRGGAHGYLPTSLARDAAFEAMRFVLAGGTFVPASALVGGDEPARPAATALPRAVRLRLSPRERQVASRLCEGRPNKAIARELAISESTVKVFVRRILAKSGASNRTEAASLLQFQLDPLTASAD